MIFTALALIAGLVFIAVQAEGRELSRTTTNDGGAWLVNRSISAVAHRNRATGELSSFVRVTDSPTADVYQAGDLVVVHDAATNRLYEVDTRSFVADLDPTELPEFSTVVATDHAIVVIRTDPLAVWRIEQADLPGVKTMADLQPLVSGTASGRVAVSPDGRIAVVDNETQELTWITSDGQVLTPLALDIDGDIIDITVVEASAIVLTSAGDLVVANTREVEHIVRWQDQTATTDQPALLQQSSVRVDSLGLRAAQSVALVTAGGELIEVSLVGDPIVSSLGSLPGDSPAAPIVHNGCVYGLVANPPQFGVACDGFQSRPLTGAGSNLRLRMVNGWIWVNDVDSGTAYASDENLEFQQFDDWGPAIELAKEDQIDERQAIAEELSDADDTLVEDPDALGSIQDSDDFDPSEANVAPVAIDDVARTRVDRSVVVDVLSNDIDENNDILIVTSVEPISGSANITVTPSGEAVQVAPAAGFAGVVEFRYSISDGKSDPVSAIVTVDVVAADSTNRPPTAVTDVIATAPGHTTTVDVLLNDSDPDGDAIALDSIEAPTGTLRWDPIGQVTFTPDNTTDAGWIELPYVVIDDLGAETEGLLRVEIRDDGANQEPDARNDQATTVAGRAVVLNLLANDSDPDGDPLIVGSQPRLLEPVGAVVQTSTTSDGEFVFRSENPGTFIFSYTVNDASDSGSESDSARIRIDVVPAARNLPPVAVRDDVVIAVGETRIVYALENDGDPDGDLVSIVDWQTSDGLQVSEYNDGTGHVGFQITVEPGTVTQPNMTYSISDGVNDPVSAPIVVAVVQRTASDQPPIANDDVIEARAGSSVTGIPVLANDFDPEAGALSVSRVGDAPAAEVTISEDRQTISIDIAPDAVSSFSIPYDIQDRAGNGSAAVLRVQLIDANAPNRPPVARTDAARTKQGETLLINVLSNDSDPDSDVIALESVNAQPEHGFAEITDQGTVRYQPDPQFTGTDVLRYSIVDAQGDRAIGDVFIGVQEDDEANLSPVANDDSYVLAGVPSTTPLDVTNNDFDPEGDPIRVVRVSSVSHGSVLVDEFGRVEYQPPVSLDDPVAAVFTYVIVDTAGNSAQATVTVELDAYAARPEPTPDVPFAEPEPTPEPEPEPETELALEPTPTPTPTPTPEPEENQLPIAVNDERGPVRAGTQVDVNVLENDLDPDGETSELTIVSTGVGGNIVGDTVTITAGEETLVVPYTIEDADGGQASAVITVVVIENQGPTIATLDVITPFETPVDLEIASQAVDPDEDDLFFVCCENIRGGAVSNVQTAANTFALTFTPDDEFIGIGGFSYRADDQNGHQVAGSVVINVSDPGNRAPETIGDSRVVPQGENISVDLSALTSDVDDDPLTYSLLSEPSGISVIINGATALVSVPRAVDIGNAGAFTYQVSDGFLTATGTVNLEITEGANRPPEALDYAEDVPAAGSTTVNLASLTTELDPGDFVTYSLATGAAAGITADLNGSLLQISPSASSINETVTFTYTATDSRGATDSATITITVVDPTSPAPSASPDTAQTERNELVLVDVVANDADPLGEGLTLDDVSSQWGNASIVANELQFDPGDRVGTSIVTYTVSDSANRETTSTATIETIGVPDQPAPPDVVRGSTEVTITWVEPADNGRPVEGYRIRSNEPGAPETVGRQNSYTWTGLTNGQEYTFTVVAFNSVGDSLPSDPSPEVTPDELPETPAPPTVTRDDGKLDVAWTEPTNLGSEIDRYELQIGPLQGPPLPIVGRLDHEWEELTNGNFYTFTVRAHNAAGWSGWSAPSEEVRPSARPDPLTIGTTSRGSQGGALTVNWSNNSINGAPILEYEVRSSAAGVTPNPVGEPDRTSRSYDWANLPNGVDMSFSVRARNEAGWSDWSGESNVEQACGVPSAPSNLVPVRGDGQVALTWVAPNDAQDCPVQNYIVNALRNGSVVSTQNSTTTSHAFTGLTNGDQYRFEVIPSNVIGTGTASARSIEVTPAGPPICLAGANFSASINAPRAINLSWSGLAANNGAAISDFQINSGNGYQSLGSNATSTTMAPLANGTQYSYDIRAVNEVGVSGRCASTSATTWALPSAVSVTTSFDADTEVWEVVATGGTNTGSVVDATNTMTTFRNGSPLPPISSSSRTHSHFVTTDGNYSATYEACNAAGCRQGTSAPLSITLAAPPEPMTANEITVTPLITTNVFNVPPGGLRVSLALTSPNDNGSDIDGFRYQVQERGNSGWQQIDDVTVLGGITSLPGTTAHVFLGYSSHPSGPNLGTTYQYRIRAWAYNGKGVSEDGPWVTITAQPPQPVLDFIQNSAYDCTSSSPPALPQQCHRVSIQMYGFPPNQTYSWSNATQYPIRLEQINPPTPPRTEDGCFGSPNITTDASGATANTEIFCLSRLGSDLRFTADGYASPIQSGLPG